MAVRIRMKRMGRKNRPFFRICAVDARSPRDGRVLEELGTYDPMVPDVDARVTLDAERVCYWLGVGAQPSDKVSVFIKKYGAAGTHIEQMAAARQRLALPRVVPPAPEPVVVFKPRSAAAEAAASEEAPPAEASAETEAAPAAEATEGGAE